MTDTTKPIVTRIAPSPTGLMHCGTIRTALYNYLLARKHGGTFYLRIEDTDQKRFVPGAEDYIRRSFEWLGIEPDYSPWRPGPGEFSKMRQSERDYTRHVDRLLQAGRAYYAFDTEAELEAARSADPHFSYSARTRLSMRNSLTLPADEVARLVESGGHVIRFKVEPGRAVAFTDAVRDEVSFCTDDLDDKVLVKSNGIPTYHLASVCDDHDMGTTHVIRGEEWLPSTPLHILLYEAMGWDPPSFGHLPTILRPDGRGKFSKRDALKYDMPIFPFGGQAPDDKGTMVAYKGYLEEGFEPAAVLNFLLMLGWAPEDGREIFSLDEMVEEFDIDRVGRSGARYDIEKARWFNQQYVSAMDDTEALSRVSVDRSRYDAHRLAALVDLARSRATYASDMQRVVDIFESDSAPALKTRVPQVMDHFASMADGLDWEDPESIKSGFMRACAENSVKPGKALPDLRNAVALGAPGPDLFTTMWILGRDRTLARILSSIDSRAEVANH